MGNHEMEMSEAEEYLIRVSRPHGLMGRLRYALWVIEAKLRA
jgi:hypothetical protein